MFGANDGKVVAVYAGTLWQAELVKGLLDSNAIQCVIQDESLGVVTSPYLSMGGDVFVLVQAEDEAAALKVIEENTVPESPVE